MNYKHVTNVWCKKKCIICLSQQTRDIQWNMNQIWETKWMNQWMNQIQNESNSKSENELKCKRNCYPTTLKTYYRRSNFTAHNLTQ